MTDQTAKNVRKRLVTFLGPADYHAVSYKHPEGSAAPVKTRFVTYALTQFYSFDEIDILSTPEVFETNSPTGENFARLKERLEKDKDGEGKGWSPFDQQSNAPRPLRTYRRVELRRGEDENSLWGQFDTIKEACNPEGCEVFVDITHGFRSFGFLTGAVAGFLQLTSKTGNRPRFFYGAHEEDKDEAPILDVSLFAEILAWAAAINVFNLTGRAAHLASASGQALLADLVAASAHGKDKEKLQEFEKALRDYSADFETLRTGRLLLGLPSDEDRPKSSSQKLRDSIGEIMGTVKENLPPVAGLLAETSGWLEDFDKPHHQPDTLAGPEGHQLTSALAQRYVDVGRYMEAITTVQEGLSNLACTTEAARPTHKDCVHGKRSLNMEDFRAAMKAINGSRTGSGESEIEFDVIGQLKKWRNDIDHAGYQQKPANASEISAKGRECQKQMMSLPAGDLAQDLQKQKRKKSVKVLNISNHSKDEWPSEQRNALDSLFPGCEVIDLGFPNIGANADGNAIQKIAEDLVRGRCEQAQAAIVQGEYALTFAIVQYLLQKNLKCFTALGDRTHDSYRFLKFIEYVPR